MFSFDIHATDGRARAASFHTPRGVVETPVFMPVGTLATVKALDPDELRATAVAVAEAAGLGHWTSWSIAWQSAGRTPEPWLGPDILHVIDELAASENDADTPRGVVVSAVGFVSDHLEVLYDLDIEATKRAAQHGLQFARTACVNDDPTVMAALAHRVIAAATR